MIAVKITFTQSCYKHTNARDWFVSCVNTFSFCFSISCGIYICSFRCEINCTLIPSSGPSNGVDARCVYIYSFHASDNDSKRQKSLVNFKNSINQLKIGNDFIFTQQLAIFFENNPKSILTWSLDLFHMWREILKYVCNFFRLFLPL